MAAKVLAGILAFVAFVTAVPPVIGTIEILQYDSSEVEYLFSCRLRPSYSSPPIWLVAVSGIGSGVAAFGTICFGFARALGRVSFVPMFAALGVEALLIGLWLALGSFGAWTCIGT